MIALTGSVNSGRAVARAAAETVKRVHLELGGKAPVVIFADADLAAAAESLRAAGYWNSGQECGAGCRVLVHESVAERFTELLVEQVSTLIVGEPTAGAEIEMGPMISKAHFERVLGHLERAQAAGAKAALGGGALEGTGYFVAPTVLVDVPEGAACTLEEIFGPVITVETFSTEDEAVSRANEVPYGLAASAWTLNPQLGHAYGLTSGGGHCLDQLPPGAGQRNALERFQKLRLRTRSVGLCLGRLLTHQARHAQQGQVASGTPDCRR